MVVRIVVNKIGDRSHYTVYDVEGLSRGELEQLGLGIFFSPNTDEYEFFMNSADFEKKFTEKYLMYGLKTGQFDQRASAAEQCVRLLSPQTSVTVRSSRIVLASDPKERQRLTEKLVNPVDSEVLEKSIPSRLGGEEIPNTNVPYIGDIASIARGLTPEDIDHIEEFYKNEGRRPTETEVLVLDTYWSDHCRHTTFLTHLVDINIENHPNNKTLKTAYDKVLDQRAALGRGSLPMSLMELGTINSRYQQKFGGLEDFDKSDEINACSIKRTIKDSRGGSHDYLIMFKNETHNHPTQIEPFGGASTCLGGAIRDPLSGRSYVYHSMRLTGAAANHFAGENPELGRLRQTDICQQAALGFSSYGNQIGLTTGLVDEVYHPGYVAKRMEVGAVIGAAPRENVVRLVPQPGDLILLVGARTGRDGIGGATGSSEQQTNQCSKEASAEVQKGNPPEERKLQRLFRNSDFARRIKRCNDFGAGGVSVAVGELADSLEIYLDRVKLKYSSLNPTEIAISESQERMAIVIDPADLEKITNLCDRENAESTVIAQVTDSGRVIMKYEDKTVFDLPRSFIDTNGAQQSASVRVGAINRNGMLKKSQDGLFADESSEIAKNIFDHNNVSRRGLAELFDNTIGSRSVLMPFGGKFMSSPVQVAAAMVPLTAGETTERRGAESVTASLMSYGFNPDMSVSPFYMGIYSVVESAAKLVAAGADYQKIRLSLQEFFPSINKDNWNLPFEALLGASHAMTNLGLAAIGGKDSMSGTYKDTSVPPTLISFGFTTEQADKLISTDFKSEKSNLYLIGWARDCEDDLVPDFETLKSEYESLYKYIRSDKILSAFALGRGGASAAAVKMALGNRIGFKLDLENPYDYIYGAALVESEFELPFKKVGTTISGGTAQVGDSKMDIAECSRLYHSSPNAVYPDSADFEMEIPICAAGNQVSKRPVVIDNPSENNVFIPIFPGTNCEYDMIREFEQYGSVVVSEIFRDKTEKESIDSVHIFKKRIDECDILVLSGGFSAGDEPDGSAKFIASALRNPMLREAVHGLLDRKGLILGICNGFQALVRLGLLPYGRIQDPDENMPVLAPNIGGHHIARLSPVVIKNNNSPWLRNHNVGDVIMTPFSHGEGRFAVSENLLSKIIENGQIATEYMEDLNGSAAAIEGLISADGLILGKMGHVERVSQGIYKNIPYSFDTSIIKAGAYYKRGENV